MLIIWLSPSQERAKILIMRRLARDAGCEECQIVAKVERAEAVANDEIIDEIILASDVVAGCPW